MSEVRGISSKIGLGVISSDSFVMRVRRLAELLGLVHSVVSWGWWLRGPILRSTRANAASGTARHVGHGSCPAVIGISKRQRTVVRHQLSPLAALSRSALSYARSTTSPPHRHVYIPDRFNSDGHFRFSFRL
jgi:hypothetical protein